MSVTRHKIIQWYHLQLNCDKCGSRMGESKFIPSFTNDWTKAHYEAKCPNCGNEMLCGVVESHREIMWRKEGEKKEERISSKLFMISNNLLKFPVIFKAGRCTITDALNPVPTLVGHDVKKPYFLLLA